jgi:predicted HicB family RNase H-like nuclease
MAKKNTVESRAREVLQFARSLAESDADWIALHNGLFGIGGRVTAEFSTDAERTAFARTGAFEEIMALIEKQKDAEPAGSAVAELAARANGNISLRLPKSIHAALLAEAQAEGVSLNQLCLAKLCTQLRAAV